MAEEYCSECGCEIGEDACEREGTFYCCEPCADGDDCECGCIDEEEEACD